MRTIIVAITLVGIGCAPNALEKEGLKHVYRTEVLPEMKKATQEIGQMTGGFYKEYFKPKPVVRDMPRVRPVPPDLRIMAERDRQKIKQRMAEMKAQQGAK